MAKKYTLEEALKFLPPKEYTQAEAYKFLPPPKPQNKTPTNTVGVNSSINNANSTMQNKAFSNTGKSKTPYPSLQEQLNQQVYGNRTKLGYQGPVAQSNDRLGYMGNPNKTDIKNPPPKQIPLSQRIDNAIKSVDVLGSMANASDTASNLMVKSAKERQQASQELKRMKTNPDNLSPKEYAKKRMELMWITGLSKPTDEYMTQFDHTAKSTASQFFNDQQQTAEQNLRQGLDDKGNFAVDVGLGAANLVSKAGIASMTGAPFLGIVGAEQAGEAGQKALDEGASAGKATAMAVGSGVITAGIESIGGIGGKILNKSKIGSNLLTKLSPKATEYIMNFANTKLGNIVTNALSEGGEEFTEYYAQRLLENVVMNKNTPYDIKEALYNAGVGGAIGGMFGAVTSNSKNAQMKVDTDVQNSIADGTQEAFNNPRTENVKSIQQQAYEKQINDVMNDRMTVNKLIVVGDTPSILQNYGASQLKITLGQQDVRKIAYPEGYMGGKHNLGFHALEQLPKQLEHPVAIMKSSTQPNSLVVFTELLDTENRPVMIPLHLDKQGNIGVSNEVASMYGRKGFDSFIEQQRNNGNILYENKNRGLQTLPLFGLQLPKLVSATDPIFNPNVPQNTTGVNNNYMQNPSDNTHVVADLSLFNETDLTDLNKARKKVIEYAKANFPDTVVNKDTQMVIGISRQGMDKLLSGNLLKEKYASAFYVPQLIENAKKVATANNSKEKTQNQVVGYTYFDSQISMAGENYTAHIRVKNTAMGDKYYGHTLSGMKAIIDDIKIEPSARSFAEKSAGHPVKSLGSNISVAQPQTSVNSQYMQNGQSIFGENTVGAAEIGKNGDKGYFREAKVLPKTIATHRTFAENFREIQHQLGRKFSDSGNEFARAGGLADDKILYPMYNNAKQARAIAESMLIQSQTDINGDVVGKALGGIFKPVLDKGNEYTTAFNDYLLNIHHIDRMAQGKPVFGETTRLEQDEKAYNQFVGRPIEEAKQIANELLRKYPEFQSLANEVYQYNRNLMQYRIDTGLVSKEQAEQMNEMYPYYVPTFRDKSAIAGSKASRGSATINQGVKKATGSSLDILPIHESMARQTMQTIQAGKRNLLAQRLFDDAQSTDKLNGIVQEVSVADEIFDTEANLDEMPELRNTFKFYDNGKAIIMKVNPELYEGIKSISSTDSDYNIVLSVVKGANDLYKKLITAYNPLFVAKNFIKDIQDVGMYSRDIVAFARNYPKAVAQIKNNSRLWQKYQALGGFGSSVFDYERGYKTEAFDEKSIGQKALDKIEDLNYAVEQAPRFAEFLSVVEKGGEGYENLMEAMYAAADVTVNFGRSGTWGKTLNSTFVPFFNPSVQGFDKMVRTMTTAKGIRSWTVLIIRCVALGIIPSVLNELIYGDDEEYQYIHSRDKDNNYLFKISEDKWLKIPKGRALAVFGNAGQRALRYMRGDEEAWAGYITGVVDNIAPVNPITSNIFAPVLGTMFNTTWYDTPIESQRLDLLPDGERYDESTDYFSKWLGGMLNYSPKKINYILDSYTGVLGDFILPLATPRAEQNPIAKAFILDSTMSNKISSDFYDKVTEITEASNSAKTSEDDKLIFDLENRYLNKQAKAVVELNKEMRRIENSDMVDKDKKQEIKEIKTVINGIQKNALLTLPSYEKSLRKYSNMGEEMAYVMANKEVFGAEYALRTYNKKVYENALSSGASMKNFFIAYFITKDIESDKDYKGDTIPLSEGKKKKQAIDNVLIYASQAEKNKLYKALGVPKSLY